MIDYAFLKSDFPREGRGPGNRFFPVSESDVNEAERRLGIEFPVQLREFYLQVGCGFLRRSAKEGAKPVSTINRIIGPLEVAELHSGEGEMAPPEGFLPEELPVFEVGDDQFLVMRPWGGDADAVFDRDGRRVASGFMEFVRKMFYEDPVFFLNG